MQIDMHGGFIGVNGTMDISWIIDQNIPSVI